MFGEAGTPVLPVGSVTVRFTRQVRPIDRRPRRASASTRMRASGGTHRAVECAADRIARARAHRAKAHDVFPHTSVDTRSRACPRRDHTDASSPSPDPTVRARAQRALKRNEQGGERSLRRGDLRSSESQDETVANALVVEVRARAPHCPSGAVCGFFRESFENRARAHTSPSPFPRLTPAPRRRRPTQVYPSETVRELCERCLVNPLEKNLPEVTWANTNLPLSERLTHLNTTKPWQLNLAKGEEELLITVPAGVAIRSKPLRSRRAASGAESRTRRRCRLFEIAREERRRRSRRRRGRREAREGAETPSGRDRGRDGETYDGFPVFGRGKEARRDEPARFPTSRRRSRRPRRRRRRATRRIS